MPGWIDSDINKDPSDYSEAQNERESLSGSEHWSLPWSDLMMTMFVLFAMILSTQHNGPRIVERFLIETENAAPAAKRSPILFPSGEVLLSPKKIYTLSYEAIEAAQLADIDVVLEKDDTVRISVQGPLFFDLGSAGLNDETLRFLRHVSQMLKQTRNEIHVVGHTDDVPVRSQRYPTNWELSAARAANVARYLIETGGLVPGRFSIVGQGMYRPLMPNMTETERQRNRRVDILITKKPYRGSEETM